MTDDRQFLSRFPMFPYIFYNVFIHLWVSSLNNERTLSVFSLYHICSVRSNEALLGRIARIAQMRPVAAAVARYVVCLSPMAVSVLGTPRRALQNRRWAGLLQTRVGPTNHELDEDAHWRHLANTIKWSVRGAMRLYVKLFWPLVIFDKKCFDVSIGAYVERRLITL